MVVGSNLVDVAIDKLLSMFCSIHANKDMRQAYILKHNPESPILVILLMTTGGKKWHVNSLSSSL